MLTNLEIIRHQDLDDVEMQVRHKISDQVENQVQYRTEWHVWRQVWGPVYEQAAQVEFQLPEALREFF